MSLVDMLEAKAHAHAEDAPDEQIAPYLSAAELSAANFLNRKVYATQGELDAAIALVPASLLIAAAVYDAAAHAADSIADLRMRTDAVRYADDTYFLARDDARATRQGIVINDAIKAAILLIFGHLYANREDAVTGVTVAQMPMGSQYLLMPYRVGMGV